MMEYKLTNLENIDKSSLNWTFNRVGTNLPPCVLNICGKNYQISNFDSESSLYLYGNSNSFQEAMELSLSFYGDITLPELAKLAAIATNFNVSAENLSIFRKKNIKGRKNIDTLLKAALLPNEILLYTATKDIPLKTVALLTSFSQKAINFVKNRIILSKEPSAAEFINFVNLTADFKEITETTEYSADFVFPSRISPEREFIETQLKNINNDLSPATVKAKDFFEKSQIEFSFNASSYEQYIEICQKLTENSKSVQDFFNKLNSYDIC